MLPRKVGSFIWSRAADHGKGQAVHGTDTRLVADLEGRKVIRARPQRLPPRRASPSPPLYIRGLFSIHWPSAPAGPWPGQALSARRERPGSPISTRTPRPSCHRTSRPTQGRRLALRRRAERRSLSDKSLFNCRYGFALLPNSKGKRFVIVQVSVPVLQINGAIKRYQHPPPRQSTSF